jgi:biotin/methionine sulfoxide reductase
MHRAVAPVGLARDDHEIFAGLAARLGTAAAFTEGRVTTAWLEHIYEAARPRAEAAGVALPSFAAFWAAGKLEFSVPNRETVMLDAFRADPEAAPLSTPSGKIEIGSARIAGYGYADCPGHPVWRAPAEYLGAPGSAEFPLHLLSNQPRTRLHGQYDHGSVSRASKVAGREPLTMHPQDAATRGISDGVIRVFNARGAFLAGVVLSDGIRPGVVQIATGAWYDPEEPGVEGSLDKHGNPNVVTPDIGSSRLSQGCSAQSTLVEVEAFAGEAPAITAFDPPRFVERNLA